MVGGLLAGLIKLDSFHFCFLFFFYFGNCGCIPLFLSSFPPVISRLFSPVSCCVSSLCVFIPHSPSVSSSDHLHPCECVQPSPVFSSKISSFKILCRCPLGLISCVPNQYCIKDYLQTHQTLVCSVGPSLSVSI